MGLNLEKVGTRLQRDLEVETGNMQGVAAQGERVLVMMPRQSMTKAEALTHAAWLVALAGGREAYLPVLDAVEAT